MPITNYYWDVDTDNVVLEEDEEGNAIAEYTQEPSLYGELIAQERDGQASFYNFDGQGSTRELTDENQNVTDTYTYDAFGVEVARTGSTTNSFRYKGQYGYYVGQGLATVYIRARDYSYNVGRWCSRDPVAFASGDSHAYRYVFNNPLQLADPSGLKCISCGGKLRTSGELLKTLDREVLGTPYTDLMKKAIAISNANFLADPMFKLIHVLANWDPLIQVDKTGVIVRKTPVVKHSVGLAIPADAMGIASRLFFVDFDVAETSPGDCYLHIFETRIISDVDPNLGNRDGQVTHPEQTDTPPPYPSVSVTTLIDLRTPHDCCNKRIIFVDLPANMGIFQRIDLTQLGGGVRKPAWQHQRVNQFVRLKDKGGATVDSVNHFFRTGFVTPTKHFDEDRRFG